MSHYRAILTGSRVYGTPKEDSDIDLVVHISEAEILQLSQLADEMSSEMYLSTGSVSLRFGRLNLLCVAQREDYLRWEKGTEVLIAQKPVTRETAVKTFLGLKNGK